MKLKLVTGVFVFSASLLCAQEKTETQQKVRIKKVEIVNGVEKVTDTSYTIDGPLKLGMLAPLDNAANDGKSKKMMIITDDVHGDNVTIASKEELDEQVKEALKAAGIDQVTIDGKDLLMVNSGVIKEGEKDGQKTKIIVIRSAKITTASDEDCKALGKTSGIADNKLAIDNMSFYPNPNDGKFTLNFTLPGKGDVDVSVMDIEGKQVYSESLKNFSGNYKKEIDISANPKGTYFVKVKQGNHSQIKKIVLE